MWTWPLPYVRPTMPPAHGQFGIRRKYDTHTGIDLYCDPGQVVAAVEAGRIVAITPFTGVAAESPWWNETKSVMVEGGSGVVLYGEIAPFKHLMVGDYLFKGDYLGRVLTVLKEDKGLPQTMLHLELYKHGTKNPVWWREGPRPAELLDPTGFLFEGYHNG